MCAPLILKCTMWHFRDRSHRTTTNKSCTNKNRDQKGFCDIIFGWIVFCNSFRAEDGALDNAGRETSCQDLELVNSGNNKSEVQVFEDGHDEVLEGLQAAFARKKTTRRVCLRS